MYRYAQSLVAFVAVGETGAFVKAAERLGVSPSVISHHIARLEDEIGQTLVHRTTRKLTLSENGRRLFDVAQKGFGAVESALNQIEADAEDIAGALRIALPAFVPDPDLEARVMEFALRYPNVAMTLDYTDQRMDLVKEGYDLAIRIGDMPASSLMRRKIGEVTHVLVAAPEFLLKHRSVHTPADLARIPFVSMGEISDTITMKRGADTTKVCLDIFQMQVQSILAARSATLAGVGLGNLPLSLIEADIASGRLIRLLPGWEMSKLTIQAVWPGTSRRGSLINRFINIITEHHL
ncbi:LysR family transcriptional regulator [Thalassobius sp. I31.1]|uniref:LysR family transcriptional regulator n=1 Tax=Thalassobius sp. I31.1 TaxID=2109912 RepID=UPI000D1A0CFB|nr:LysR family transcriptional regulator [Thalassobius sp. I31.1]